MVQQALSTAFSLGVNFIVCNESAVQFNPAVTVSISLLQEKEAATPMAFFSLYFAVCFFGPLLGGLLAGLSIPTFEEEDKSAPKFTFIMEKLNLTPNSDFDSTDSESTRDDEEDSRPLLD